MVLVSDFVLDDTKRVGGVPELRLPSVELVVLDGPSRGTKVIMSAAAKVGSSEACALRLADPTVSRVHCELLAQPGGVRLIDAGSTNGTFVGDVRVHDVELPLGSVVRVGASAFRLDARDEPQLVALSSDGQFGELLGASLEMRALYAVLERVSRTDVTVLVVGETGTGKDVVARSVHAASPRRAAAFIPVDCGAIPEQLFESELFGHMRGAFTGALSDRKGVFEEAAGGTLFLDEIGELPLSMQAKLLRALESKTIRRVGASHAVPVDVRVIAATNRSLGQCVNEGTFREDLYYRLAVVEVKVPPLRARRDDIPDLARRFHARVAPKGTVLPESFIESLRKRPWPGNVRELRNFVDRAVALGLTESMPNVAPTAAPSAPTMPSGIESIIPVHLPLKEARDAWTETFERVYIEAMLKRTQGNVTKAAELAGVSRRFLQRTCVRLGLRAQDLDDE
jgi:transcriptional regulator with PAS, ATPase and Fis domain